MGLRLPVGLFFMGHLPGVLAKAETESTISMGYIIIVFVLFVNGATGCFVSSATLTEAVFLV
jgi:hypothetical protein